MFLKRNVCAILVVMTTSFSALADDASRDVAERDMVAGLVAEMAYKKAEVCFQYTRLMLAGFSDTQKGIDIDSYILDGVMAPGTVEYGLMKRGSHLTRITDPVVDAFFAECLRDN